jgi:hypothetical protein
MKSKPGPSVNLYHEQPENAGRDQETREESIKAGKEFLEAAEEAVKNGDLAYAQTLRRLIGD